MDYKQALEYLYSFISYEKTGMPPLSPTRYNLARMGAFLAQLGNPQQQYPSVLIAGTKGKGSTAVMTAAALIAAGRKVGLYSQPHLHTFRERVRVNDVLISETETSQLVEQVLRPTIEKFHHAETELGRLTTYEIGTALALLHFAQVGADFAVLEIGLGGRLDAVNVVQPLVSAIASISFDHTEVLGHTLTEIAGEKAGIIKLNGLTITAPQAPDALAVIQKVCAERHSQLFEVGPAIGAQRLAWEQPLSQTARKRTTQPLELSWQADFPRPQAHIPPLRLDLPLLGPHQTTNAALAAGILSLLELRGIKVEQAAIKNGFERVSWPGRLEVLADEAGQPLIIADGAHNAESARRLREALAENFAFARLIMVVGAARDKDIEGIFQELNSPASGPPPAATVLTQADNPRAASPQTLLTRGGSALNTDIRLVEDVATALDVAKSLAGPDDLICVTGSLFVVADARRALGLANASDPVY